MASSQPSLGRSYLAAASIALISGGVGLIIGFWLRPSRAAVESKPENDEADGTSHQSAELVPPSNLVDFLLTVGQLKNTVRTGWVDRNVVHPESVADHSHRMACMALCIQDPSIDKLRCIQIALVHDLAEALVGDITPEENSGISKVEKMKLEADAMVKIRNQLGADSSLASYIHALWQEYEDAATPEAKMVKDLDKTEMLLQAYSYETQQYGLDLQEFFDSVKGRVKHPDVLSILDALHVRRAAFKEHGEVTKVPGMSDGVMRSLVEAQHKQPRRRRQSVLTV